MKEIDWNDLKKINVDDCWFEWQLEDGTRCADPYKAAADAGGWDKIHIFAAVMHHRGTIYREHRAHCHIDDAWRILAAGRFGKWKTAYLLVTLRQALRERYVQPMFGLDIPPDGIGERALKAWLKIARAYDTVHHGCVTF